MTAAEAKATEAIPASLGELGLILWRARWRLAAFGTGGLLLAAAAALASPPSFEAHAMILIEQASASGVLGDLAQLSSLASAPAAASELAVLESRTLAEAVIQEPREDDGRWRPDDERHLGLTARVDDLELRPLALLRTKLFAPPPPDSPLVLPERGLAARVARAAPGAATKIHVEFLGGTRVRLTRAGLAYSLHLADRAPEEFTFPTPAPLSYQGLELELAPWGDWQNARFELEYVPLHEAVQRFADQLSVRETALNSGVIEVDFTDSDPRRAARAVNALVAHYLDSLAERGQRRASKTVTYLQGLLDDSLAQFQKNQDLVMRLQQANPELIAPEGTASSLIEQMATLEVERVQLELSEHAFSEIVAALEAGDRRALAQIDGSLTVGVLVDPVTSGLLTELAHLEAEASTLGTDLLADHPARTKNAAATADLVTRTKEQLTSRLEGVRARRSELERLQGELRSRLAELPSGMRELAEARVELGIQRELVPYLLKSVQGAEITRSSGETLADLVDRAVPPTELSEPDPLRYLALGLLAGLGLGVGVAFLREPRRGRLHGGGELAQALGLERTFVLPRLGARELVFQSARTGRDAEVIRQLRGALRFAPDGQARRAIGVAALGGAEESGRLAAELALAFESEGRRALLVEAAPSQPALPTRFGLAPGEGAGFAQYLAGGPPWSELVRRVEGGPAVLGAGRAGASVGDLLARAESERFLAAACGPYDVVVLALPAAEILLAAPAFARALDVLCLTHRARSLPRARVEALAGDLRAAGVRALAGVLIEKRA